MIFAIIEDDDDKRRDLVAAVAEALPTASLHEARSYNAALALVRGQPLQAIVLDMSLPSFDPGLGEDGGRGQAYGGRELMRHLTREGPRVPVVVVTQFDNFGQGDGARSRTELSVELREEFGAMFRTMIFYSVIADDWRSLLKNALLEIAKEDGHD